MKCSKCNSEVKDGMKFCPKCATEMPQIHFCSQCGAELKEGMKFCPKCGCSIYGNSAHVDNSAYVFNNGNDITIIHKEQSGTKKWLKYFAIGFTCYLVLSFVIGMCSNNDVSKFSGRYSLDDAKNRNWHYIINVTKDGRCVGGLDGDKFLGNVNPISDNAFELSNAIYDSWYLLNYREGKHVGSRECHLNKIVFDIKNNRVYFDRNDYLNRDISNPEYSILSH